MDASPGVFARARSRFWIRRNGTAAILLDQSD
jgi:hypothetical protein